jgi:hypothetical protein
MRRVPVVAPVPRDEDHLPASYVGDDERVARVAVRRLDDDLIGVWEQRVQTGAADDTDWADHDRQPSIRPRIRTDQGAATNNLITDNLCRTARGFAP